MTTTDHREWPPALRAALASPPPDQKDWPWSLAPQVIGLFLWIAFLDQIPQEALRPGGVAWPVLGATVAGVSCYLFLYRSPAMWGMTTGRPGGVIATSTFGVTGATWIPGLLVACVGVVWLAVSVAYATSLCLRGLILFGMLDPRYLSPRGAGRGGTPGGLFLVTSLLWCYAAAFVGRYLVRVSAALMNAYSIVPALLLGLAAVLAFPGLRGHDATRVFRGVTPSGIHAGVFSALVTVQMIFGFFATTGLMAADWGAVARDARGVKAGGWVGVAMGSWVVATLAILTTAGAESLSAAGHDVRGAPGLVRVGPWRYSAALEFLLGGRLAGVAFLVLGLAALSFACYSAYVTSLRLNQIWPRVSRSKWTILGAGLAWMLVACGLVNRMLDVFSLVGGLTAPAVGAISADYVRSRGVWPGPRLGFNPPGWFAWALGSLVGLTPLVGRAAGVSWPGLEGMQPAAVFGFVTAFLTYLVAAGLGAESAADAGAEFTPDRSPG